MKRVKVPNDCIKKSQYAEKISAIIMILGDYMGEGSIDLPNKFLRKMYQIFNHRFDESAIRREVGLKDEVSAEHAISKLITARIDIKDLDMPNTDQGYIDWFNTIDTEHKGRISLIDLFYYFYKMPINERF